MYLVRFQQKLKSFEEKCEPIQKVIMLLDIINGEKIIRSLENERKGRRDDYPIRMMWYCLITFTGLNVKTISEGLRLLEISKELRDTIGIESLNGVPTPSVFSRFLSKLTKYNDELKEIFDELVDELKEKLGNETKEELAGPAFGKDLAIDSTDISSWSNGYGHKRKKRKDEEASFKREDYVVEDEKGNLYKKTKKWFGYKLHLLIDSNYEIPMGFRISTAKDNDCEHAIPLLRDTIEKHGWVKEAETCSADKGYDFTKFYRELWKENGIAPIIPIRKMSKEQKWITNEKGTPLCAAGRKMVFWGYENKTGTLKYRCPLAVKGKGKCTMLNSCFDNKYGLIVRIKIEDDYRRHLRIPRETKRFEKEYKKRTSVERVNSRLKLHYGLDDMTVMGEKKITTFLSVSLLCMLAVAVGSVRKGEKEKIRKIYNIIAA